MGKIIKFFILLLFSAAFNSYAEAAEDAISFVSPDTYFAAGEIEINLALKAPEAAKEGIFWNLKYSGRTVSSGKCSQEQNNLKIKFPFPKLNDGVIAQAIFTCTDKQGKNLLAKELYFYPPNPFAGHKQFLAEQKISFWNPSGKGRLKDIFKALDVPYEKIASIDQATGKTVIIQGIDFGQFSGLETDIATFAKKEEVTIIILAPLSGSFKLKPKDYDRITLAKNDIIHDFSRKFDSSRWGSSPVSARSFKTVSSDDDISLSSENGNEGFTFCRFDIGKSKIYLCYWDIDLAEKSPTPLYLLSKIIFNTDKSNQGENK